ncbi:MAG: acetyl-CoA carboxylase biotin carboxyl carrier protein [Candidatus Omnitrophica bacterium]|nr:acetyl-CoA carboxylase biotin carboxyl carrier protein [Candidatus Omnitrophota bacterium]
MNLKEIKEVINLMNENNLTEIEIEKEGMRIKLRKAASDESSAAPVIVERKVSASSDTVTTKAEEIKAPMVGTFYRAPSPESPPYVEVGQAIEPGQVICIIEAMKLMNEIKSEVRGKIKEILVENTEPVEFGQSLFLVEPI